VLDDGAAPSGGRGRPLLPRRPRPPSTSAIRAVGNASKERLSCASATTTPVMQWRRGRTTSEAQRAAKDVVVSDGRPGRKALSGEPGDEIPLDLPDDPLHTLPLVLAR